MENELWNELQNKLRDFFAGELKEELNKIVLSGRRRGILAEAETKSGERHKAETAGEKNLPKGPEKVKVRPVLIKEQLLFQETVYRGNQVFHGNFTAEEMCGRLADYMEMYFNQAQADSLGGEATALVGRKGNVTVRRKQKAAAGRRDSGNRPGEAGQPDAGQPEAAGGDVSRDLSHNRTKKYILPEGTPVDFLVGLGVQTPEGRTVKAKYDKFRQINRYLEFIRDVLEELPRDRMLRIIDFGCGKSYLTFAMYYYLREIAHRQIQVTGLDLKADVIRRCNELAGRLGYEDLSFEQGDISSFQGAHTVDMVVSLHACDKATDYALEKAVKWGARVIMAVPCCQHELNGQIRCGTLQPVLKYGLIRERMAALLTDALRADILEQNGYDTQILEFIDMEHTPKNILIRAVKREGMRPKGRVDSLEEILEFLHVNPTLKELL